MKPTDRDKLSEMARACRRFLDHYDTGADNIRDEETWRVLNALADRVNVLNAEIEDRWFRTCDLCPICQQRVYDDPPGGYVRGRPVHQHCLGSMP